MVFKFKGNNLSKAFEKVHNYIKNAEKLYIMDIQVCHEKRSLNQNNYYWGVVIPILSDHFGYTSNEMHQICSRTYLSYEKNGESFVRSTSDLSTIEAEEYYEKIRAFMKGNHNIDIPLPNEVTNEMWVELQNKYNY